MREPINVSSEEISSDETKRLADAYEEGAPVEFRGELWQVQERDSAVAAGSGSWVISFQLIPARG